MATREKPRSQWGNPNWIGRRLWAPRVEWERWQQAWERNGVRPARWIRTALNHRCDLEEALLQMEAGERESGVLVDRSIPEGEQ